MTGRAIKGVSGGVACGQRQGWRERNPPHPGEGLGPLAGTARLPLGTRRARHRATPPSPPHRKNWSLLPNHPRGFCGPLSSGNRRRTPRLDERRRRPGGASRPPAECWSGNSHDLSVMRPALLNPAPRWALRSGSPARPWAEHDSPPGRASNRPSPFECSPSMALRAPLRPLPSASVGANNNSMLAAESWSCTSCVVEEPAPARGRRSRSRNGFYKGSQAEFGGAAGRVIR
jgi:hypothetical protein